MQKVILSSALAIVFVVSALTALFGAGSIVNSALETYVFKVEECRFSYSPRAVEEEPTSTEEDPQENCFIDYNQAKRDIAQGTGWFVIFAPIAWFMFLQTRKFLK